MVGLARLGSNGDVLIATRQQISATEILTAARQWVMICWTQ
jgi:hypothetical protein